MSGKMNWGRIVKYSIFLVPAVAGGTGLSILVGGRFLKSQDSSGKVMDEKLSSELTELLNDVRYKPVDLSSDLSPTIRCQIKLRNFNLEAEKADHESNIRNEMLSVVEFEKWRTNTEQRLEGMFVDLCDEDKSAISR